MTLPGQKDKAILVAGAAAGLGAATAHRLAADGAEVVIGDLNLEGASRTATATTNLVAAMVAYPMCNEAVGINGQVINVDGGTVMR